MSLHPGYLHPSPGHGQQSDLPARTVGFQLPGVPSRQGVALLYVQYQSPMGPWCIVFEDWGFLLGPLVEWQVVFSIILSIHLDGDI